jgi:hypothetical protein
MQYTCVFFETNKIQKTVEAETPEAAIALAEVAAQAGWADCVEETLGTCGVEEVFDANAVRVWMDGDRVEACCGT